MRNWTPHPATLLLLFGSTCVLLAGCVLCATEECPHSGDMSPSGSCSGLVGDAPVIARPLVAIQQSELDVATDLLMFQPTDELFWSALHPQGNLFLQAFPPEKPAQQISQAITMLQGFGVRVHSVGQVLQDAATTPKGMALLRSLALDSLTYEFRGDVASLSPAGRAQLGLEYKTDTLAQFDTKALLRVIFSRPTITLGAADANTPLEVIDVHINPYSNLLFTRDQQIVTAAGLILGSMNSATRELEVDFMKTIWGLLNVTVLDQMPPGPLFKMEGGDFIPFGEVALLGVGLRTGPGAALRMLQLDHFGSEEVAIVVDPFDHHQDRMHLDTVFNFVDDHTVMVLDSILGEESPRKRVVLHYVRDGTPEPTAMERAEALFQHSKIPYHQLFPLSAGRYHLQSSAELGAWLRSRQLQVLPVTDKQQQSFLINFLNLGGSPAHLVGVNRELEQLVRDSGANARVTTVDYEAVTSMYGAMHCSTQVFARIPTKTRRTCTLNIHGLCH